MWDQISSWSSKCECTTDQVLSRIQRVNDVTRGGLAAESGTHYPNLYPIWAYLFTEVEFKYLWWCIYIEQ